MEFCKLIEQQFMEYLNLGYGHADEQLYSPIYFRHPEIFEIYFADYGSMITNYCKIVEDVATTINHLMTNSFHNQNYKLAYQGALAVWKYCTEIAPDKTRTYAPPHNTKLLGNLRGWYLNMLLVASREVGDYDMASKALVELKCLELNH